MKLFIVPYIRFYVYSAEATIMCYNMLQEALIVRFVYLMFNSIRV